MGKAFAQNGASFKAKKKAWLQPPSHTVIPTLFPVRSEDLPDISCVVLPSCPSPTLQSQAVLWDTVGLFQLPQGLFHFFPTRFLSLTTF